MRRAPISLSFAIALCLAPLAAPAMTATPPCRETIDEATLRVALADPNVNVGAGALEGLRSESCVTPGILALLGDELTHTESLGADLLGPVSRRTHALDAAARLGPAAAPMMNQILPFLTSPDERLRLGAYEAALHAGRREPEILAAGGHLMQSKNASIRQRAAVSAMGILPDRDLFLVFRKDLLSQDIGDFVHARDTLIRWGAPVVPLLIDGLAEPRTKPVLRLWIHDHLMGPAVRIAANLPRGLGSPALMKWLYRHDPLKKWDDRPDLAAVLAGIGAPAVGELVRHLNDPTVSPYIRMALMQLPTQIILNLDPAVTASAAFQDILRYRLSLARPAELVAALGSEDPTLQIAALTILQQVQVLPISLAPRLRQLAASGNFKVRLLAAGALTRAKGSSTDVLPVLKQMAEQGNPAERREALGALGMIHQLGEDRAKTPMDKADIARLVAGLSDPDPAAARTALVQLHRAGPDPAIVPLLLPLLRSGSIATQTNVCLLLGPYKAAAAAAGEDLAVLVRKGDPQISSAASETLAKIGAPAYPLIHALLNDPRPATQLWGLLGVPFDNDKTPALEADVRRCLASPDPGVRNYAAEALRLWSAKSEGELPGTANLIDE